MSQKKVSGLSKKVPAIFQGLPDIEPEAKARESARRRKRSIGILSPRSSKKNLRFLFEAGESSLKVIIQKNSRHGWDFLEVRSFAFDSSPDGRRPFHPGLLTSWIREVTEEFAAGSDFESRLLYVGKSIYVGETIKPAVSARDMKNTLIWEIAEKLPFPVEESKILYEEQQGTTVLVAAVREAEWSSLLSSFHEAGVHPEIVTILPFAYEAISQSRSIFPLRNILLIHMSSEKTSFLVFRKKHFQSIREISVGEDHITQAMMGTLVLENEKIEIGFAQAAAVKDDLGIPTPNLMPDAKEPKLSQLSARIRPYFEKITNELRVSIIQFQKQFLGERIEEIYLSGQGAELKGIESYFAGQANLPVRMLNVSSIDSKIDLGLAALAGMSDVNLNRFNFAASEDLWKLRFERTRDALKMGTLVLAGIFALVFLLTRLQIQSVSLALENQEVRFRELAPAAKKIEELNRIHQETKEQKKILHEEITADPYWGGVLRELSRLAPSPMVFEKLSLEQKLGLVLNISGAIEGIPHATNQDQILSDFLERLNESPFFEYSSLESRINAQESKEAGIQFLIQAKLVVSLER